METNNVENKEIKEVVEEVNKEFWEAMDLGRSGVRMLGKLDNVYRVFSSDFIEIAVDTPTRFDGDVYDDFIIKEATRASIKGKRYVKGKSMSDYHAVTKRADNTDLKTNQDNNYVNFVYAIATNILKKGFSTATTKIRCGLCIPSAEYFSESAKEMKDQMIGTYRVDFPMLNNKSVVFKIEGDKLGIMPEGVVALVPLMKTKNKSKVASNIVIVIDVGHGSTDITIAVNGKPLGNSSRSYNIGGYTIETNVARFLEEKGYGASRGNIQSALKYGWIKQGLTLVDVSKYVVKAKLMFAELLAEKAKEVVGSSGLTVNEVGYFYFVGRSFLASKYTGEKYDTKDLKVLTLDAWPVKEVEMLELVSPIENEDMVKDIKIVVNEIEAELIGKEKVQADEDGTLFTTKKVLTTLEGDEIIPAEIANVTGVSLLLR